MAQNRPQTMLEAYQMKQANNEILSPEQANNRISEQTGAFLTGIGNVGLGIGGFMDRRKIGIKNKLFSPTNNDGLNSLIKEDEYAQSKQRWEGGGILGDNLQLYRNYLSSQYPNTVATGELAVPGAIGGRALQAEGKISREINDFYQYRDELFRRKRVEQGLKEKAGGFLDQIKPKISKDAMYRSAKNINKGGLSPAARDRIKYGNPGLFGAQQRAAPFTPLLLDERVKETINDKVGVHFLD